MATEQAKRVGRSHVVAMPYPGRGHINPMMNFCKLLSYKIPDVIVSFVVTEEWFGFLSTSDDVMPENIRFTTIPNVIPSEIGRGKDFPGFVEATVTKMREPFDRLLDRLELEKELPLPTVILYDFHLIWPVDVGNARNIPVACFFPMSAMILTVLCHFDLLVENGHFPSDVSERGNEVIDYIPGLPSMRLADLPTLFSGSGREVIGRILEGLTFAKKSQYLLLTTLDELESDAIAAVKAQLPIPAVYSIGPVIPYFNPSLTKRDDDDDSDYSRWLSSQPRSSVLYISQGSFLSASTAQMDEIIAGIRDSGVPFLWVARGEEDKIRSGCGEKGLVVPWCDQLRVLCHDSVGGFWSHCGWNSTKEGIFAGVPFLTYPIFMDQMTNSKMITTVWGIGWNVKKEMGFDQSLVRREDVADLVRRFMDAESLDGKQIRTKAQDLGRICRRPVSEGGPVDANIDDFVSQLLESSLL